MKKFFWLFVISFGFLLSSVAAEVNLFEKDAVLLSGKYQNDCLAVGKKGIYAIEGDKVRTIVTGAMIHSPTPILSSHHTYICSLAKHGSHGTAAVVYDLSWKKGNTIPLPQVPTAWAFAPSEAIIVVATGTGICELVPSVTHITPSPLQTRDPIHAIAHSPGGNFLLLTTSKEIVVAKTTTMQLTATLPIPDENPLPGCWLDEHRIAVITGQGEPDSFLDIYSIDDNGNLASSKPRRIASAGTPGRLQNLSVSPFGDRIAADMQILSPADFFDSAKALYWERAVQFYPVQAKPDQIIKPEAWPTFAWAPKGDGYAMIVHRIHQTPGSATAAMVNAEEEDWAVYLGSKSVTTQAMQNEKPFFVSDKPLYSLVWSQDGTRIYLRTVFGRNIAKIVCLDVPEK